MMADGKSSYDLTAFLSKSLDAHMVLPLLDFLKHMDTPVYSPESVNKMYAQVLRKTLLLDLSEDISGASEELNQRRLDTVKMMTELASQCESILTILENPEDVQKRIETNTFTAEALGIDNSKVKALSDYAALLYDSGRYDSSAFLLHKLSLLCPLENDFQLSFKILWGYLASAVLSGQWEVSSHLIQQIKEAVESSAFQDGKWAQLQNRSWLLHWSLFVYFVGSASATQEPNLHGFLDLAFDERVLNVIQTTAQPLLRYVTFAVILHRGRKGSLSDLRQLLQAESHTYSDPITSFFLNLYAYHNFESAIKDFGECQRLVLSDKFLAPFALAFKRSAGRFFFEIYCKVHQSVDLDLVDKVMGCSSAEGELWISELVNTSRLDAVVDKKTRKVVMSTSYPSVHQRVIEKTKGLSARTSQMVQNVDRHLC